MRYRVPIFVVVGLHHMDAQDWARRLVTEQPERLFGTDIVTVVLDVPHPKHRVEGLRVSDFSFSPRASWHSKTTEVYEALERSVLLTNYRPKGVT